MYKDKYMFGSIQNSLEINTKLKKIASLFLKRIVSNDLQAFWYVLYIISHID